jgi:hypothetical protein
VVNGFFEFAPINRLVTGTHKMIDYKQPPANNNLDIQNYTESSNTLTSKNNKFKRLASIENNLAQLNNNLQQNMPFYPIEHRK